ncbi:MAG: prolyl oligopeptidase family serine peptidase [Planctomycetota bacterium]|nr:prolyl oligopeptidase family serine peptidase [Planctomycetota bacterium]
MRFLVLVLLFGLLLFGGLATADEPAPVEAFLPHTPSEWLVIGPVDHRARRPFNPDAVFAKHLLDPTATPPKAGETITGERGTPQAWSQRTTNEKGELRGRIAYAYTTVDSPKDQVVMAFLRRGGTLFVNGTPHVGSIYGDRFEVPVKLVKGINHVFVKGSRGAFQLTFSKPPSGVFLAPFRQTKPDLVAGEPVDTMAGVLVVNAREEPLGQVLLRFEGNEWLETKANVGVLPIAPLSMVQVRVPLKTKEGKTAPKEPGKVEIPVKVWGAYTADGQSTTLTLDVREREKAVIRTFVSKIDDSVQRFGMREPLPGGPKDKGLVLSLHGAGVNPRGQANAYSQKPDFWLFAPTNRDRFGFDWQDWGRIDAYEVLEEGLRISGVDRSRVYLTGHSMGGHGTWHLGANDPDGFAAIAPSAGWISFDTYPGPRRRGLLTDLWHAADGASLTRKLLDNLVQLPTFILHGEKDDNVPVAQAKEMERLLTAAGAKPEVHYEPGKKHWWDGYPEPGAQCVDWPGIYELFRKTRIATAPKEISFQGVHPSVDSRHHWVEVLQLVEYGKPFSVRGVWAPEAHCIELKVENVHALRIHYPGLTNRVAINDSDITLSGTMEKEPRIWIRRNAKLWTPQNEPLPSRTKTPAAGGPFRRAFTNRFVLVHGSAGSDAEDKTLFEQARFDGQRWMYRANGQAILLSDREWMRMGTLLGLDQRNAIIYGNRDSNAAFTRLARGEPVSRHGVHHAAPAARRAPDIGAYYVGPGPKPGTLVGFCGSTGVAGSRLGFTTMLFVSGAGWPDFTFFDSSILTKGDGGVFEAGWYGRRWSVQRGSFLRKPEGPVNPK